MAEQKRFYWIKLKENFFDLETIDWLISQKNGCEYIVLYQKLCLLAANKNGRLAMQIGEMIIPYDAAKISRDTKFDFDTVVVAMELFKKIGLIFEEADGVLRIPYVEEIVGSETKAAQRVREHRKRKALQCNNNVTQEIEKENREKSLDIKSVDADATTAARYDDPDDQLQRFKDHVILSENQIADLLDKMGLEAFDDYISRLNDYIQTSGAKIKSHYATLLKWYNEDRAVIK